jgi:hypothetical protein
MTSCAEAFEISEFEAKERASNGMYSKEAVQRAIDSKETSTPPDPATQWRFERAPDESRHPGTKMLKGVEYWGELPLEEDPNKRWRLITVLENELVRNIDWPLAERRLPFYDATVGWMQGKFWGQSPAADCRYQQDFLDYMMRMVAESVRRAVQPPILYQLDDTFDRAKLQAWSSDVAIGAENPKDIRTLPYSANLQAGFGLVAQTKQSMKENTGATSIVQGHGLPNSRSSAAEATQTFRAALARVEMMNVFLEKVCLPPMGKGVFHLYQLNIEDDQDLRDRVGELPEPVSLFDIDGDYDISFVGSRNYMDAQARLGGIDRVFQLGGIPQLANLLPWQELGAEILDALGFTKTAAKIADPQRIQQNVMMQMLAGQGGQQAFGNNNGTQPALPAPETPLSQAEGGIVTDEMVE